MNRRDEDLSPNRKPGAPLLITAELPVDILEWADSLRRAHYPPERNRLRAHVTLFHALPPGVEDELLQILGYLARSKPPEARISGLMKLGGGTAIAIESPEMTDMHVEISKRMHGLLTDQDSRPLKLHITIQNKVDAAAARALQQQLGPQLRLTRFRFRGFGLYAWEGGLWRPIRSISFRG